MDSPFPVVRVIERLNPNPRIVVRKKQVANPSGTTSVATSDDTAALQQAADEVLEAARLKQLDEQRQRMDAADRARWAANAARKAKAKAREQAALAVNRCHCEEPRSGDEAIPTEYQKNDRDCFAPKGARNDKPKATAAAKLDEEIRDSLRELAIETHKLLDLGPRLKEKDFKDKTPQEIARLLTSTYMAELTKILDDKEGSCLARAIGLLCRLENEPFIQAAKGNGNGKTDRKTYYTGSEILDRVPHRDLAAEIAILIGDFDLAADLVRRLSGNHDFGMKIPGLTNPKTKFKKRYVPPNEIMVEVHRPLTPKPKKDKPKHIDPPAPSSTQTQTIQHAITLIAYGKQFYANFIRDVHDFLEVNPRKFTSEEDAQLEFDKRVSFLGDIFLVVSSSGLGDTKSITLEDLNKEYEAYRKFISCDKFFQQGANDFLCMHNFSEGNNYRTRVQLIELATYRKNPNDLMEGINFMVWLSLLKEAGVEGTLDWFKNAYRVVEEREDQLALSGYASEAFLDVQLIFNRKDLKLERICTRFEKREYESQNPRIKKVLDIFSHDGIEIDAIASYRNSGKKLYFEHKSTGQALFKEKERVKRFVAFSNIQNAIPVFMFDKEQHEIKGQERDRTIQVLNEIEQHCPPHQGYTQPLVFDKNANDITGHFKKREARHPARSLA